MRIATVRKTREERVKLLIGKTIVYGSLLPELFCELFRTAEGRRAIQLLTLEIFDFDTPELGAYVAAAILAGVDFGALLVRIDPCKDAKDIMGIESNPDNIELSEATEITPLRNASDAIRVSNRPKRSCILPVKILLGILTEGMIINASFINAIAVYRIALYFYSKDEISLDAAKLMIYILGGSIVTSDIIFNNFLSLKDGINSANSWIDFKNSPIYSLTTNNKKFALMAASKTFLSSFFHASLHYLVTKEFFWNVVPFATGLPIAESTTDYMGYSTAISAFFVFTFLKSKDFFEAYRKPFLRSLQADPGNQYDFSLISSNDRAKVWSNLSLDAKIKIALQPAIHGLIRGGYLAFIAFALFYHYVNGFLSSSLSQVSSIGVALIPLLLLFFQVFLAEKEQALNLRHCEIQTQKHPEIFCLPTHLSTLAFNFGSRAIRGFIALLSIHQMFKSVMGDRLATVLGLWIVLEHTIIEGAAFQSTMTARVERRGEEIKLALNSLRQLSCKKPRPGYTEIRELTIEQGLGQ